MAETIRASAHTITCDAPYGTHPDGGHGLHIPAGRVIAWGHAFCPVRGYRVMLRFTDSVAHNTMAPDTARWIADHDLDPSAPEAAQLAAILREMADQADALTRAWILAGRKPLPLDAEPAGTA